MRRILLPIFALALDLALKTWATRVTYLGKFGPLKMELHWNEGVFAGLFSSSAALINQVFLSSVSMLMILFLAILLFIYHKDKLPIFQWSLRALIVGFLSNIIDRGLYGRVVDYLRIESGPLEHWAFNLGDVLILMGMAGAFYQLFIRPAELWFNETARNRILIEKRFQLRMSLHLCLVLLAVWVGTVLVSLLLFRVWTDVLPGQETPPVQTFIWAYGAFFMLLVPPMVFYGLWLSRKLIGPVRAFENYLTKLGQGGLPGRDRQFKLRQDDSFKRLETLAKQIEERDRTATHSQKPVE
ncbi:MAG: signal peptidase II [Proteobacteria bacterium]|nr:MAG: signal peptidase II [Pseudomonadota bacterium]